tara:strand:- start:223 stop:402 length:180 start_codon:yes stop_codon:yes gene_type:complete
MIQPGTSEDKDGKDGVIHLLEKHKIPVTKETYINLAFMGDPLPDGVTEAQVLPSYFDTR